MTAEGAPCTEIGPHLFFSDNPRERARAVALCGGCHAVDWCREQGEALRADGHRLFGVWSGVDHGMAHGSPAHEGARQSETRCGTEAGYKRHLRLGEKSCEACREASNRASRLRKANPPGALVAQCGSRAAHDRHRRLGETCDVCAEAMARHWRERSAARRERERMEAAS
jgi:WhiB family transcriptional regulator, redox-sensing transcriptional regulator